MAQRSYTREEMEEILRRAAQRTHEAEDHVRHEDLVAAAREVGIDPDAIERVAAELGDERKHDEAVQRYVKKQRDRFWRGLSAYVITMAALGALNVLVTPSVPWALWVAFGWGLAVAFQARRAFLPPSDEQVERMLAREERKAQREARKRARREATEAWSRRWRQLGEEMSRAAEAPAPSGTQRGPSPLASAEKEIDRAIEEGVTALVAALAKRAGDAAKTIATEIERASQTPDAPPRTEFEHYVARQKTPAPKAEGTSTAATGPIVTPPPRTRVAEPADEAADDEAAEAQPARKRAQRTR